MRLSKRRVEGINPHSSRDVIAWDGSLPGFGVRVKPSGTRSYFVQYRNPQRRSRRITLGRHGVLTVEEARRAARRILVEAAEGFDPAEARSQSRQGLTVADLAQRYLEEHALSKKKPSSVKADRCNLRNHVVPVLGHRGISEVARADIAALHHRMRRTPGAANRTLALVSKMFNLAERWELRPDGTNPCRHVERYPERKLERFLSQTELAALGDALDAAEREGLAGRSSVAAIRLLILTGCRSSEILRLRWDQIDWDRRLLRLSESKTGPRVLPLSVPVMTLLRGLPRDSSQWVLPGRRGDAPLINLAKPWDRIRKKAGLKDVRIHDLRHSFASVGTAAGLGLPIIGKLLGHTQAATTQRYAHVHDDPLREASETIAIRIDRTMRRSITA